MNENTVNAQMPEETLSLEEAAEICFASGAIFGNMLEFYGRNRLHITFDGDTEAEYTDAEPEELEELEEPDDEPDPDDTDQKISENPDPIFQLAQIFTLLHPETKKLFGETSAIYGMFHQALRIRGAEGETIEYQIHGANRQWVIITWLLTKQAFAIGHYDELFVMIDTLREALTGKNPKPPKLSAMNNKDISRLDTFCTALRRRQEAASAVKDRPTAAEEDPESLRSITEIIATGNLFLPTAKAFRAQGKIAAGRGTAELDVGHGAVVKAKITGTDGSATIQLDNFEMDIEAAVGQLIHENGFHTITVTPAQIYRKYAGMDADETVSAESIQKTILAMDKLITTPAILDFTQQIEKHTRMKRRPHFDYENRSRTGTLITGVHDKKRSTTYRGSVVEDSFTIFDMPMFYAYSYAIGQLATVPANLLTGEPAKPQNAKKIRGKKTRRADRLSSEDIGLRRYLLEQIEYHRGIKEKQIRKLKYAGEKIPETHDAYILFDTVSKDIGRDISTPKRDRMLREQVYNFMMEQVKLKNIKAAEYHIKGKKYAGVKITI